MSIDFGIPTDIRSENKRLILGFLKMNGPSSREEICKQTGLPNSTTGYIMKQLREKGLILELKKESKDRGPKPIIASINESCFVAGASIYPASIFVGIFTINLDLIEITEIPFIDIPKPKHASDVLKTSLHSLLSKHNIPDSQLISLGISIPGLILPDGVVSNSSPLYWHNVPFKKILSEHFRCDITICRKLHIKTFLLETFSDTLKRPLILHTTIGNGVGGALIADGKVRLGNNGLYGEIGHIIVEPNGPLCGCGNKGCLESLISGAALAKRIKNDIKNGVETLLGNLIKKDDAIKDIIRLWGTAVDKGDKYSLKLRDFVGEHFSRVVAIAVNCFDPNTIILDGFVTEQCSDYLNKKIKERLLTDVTSPQIRNIRIITAVKEDETHFARIAAKEALWDLVQKT